jgi:hypothetical protein
VFDASDARTHDGHAGARFALTGDHSIGKPRATRRFSAEWPMYRPTVAKQRAAEQALDRRKRL